LTKRACESARNEASLAPPVFVSRRRSTAAMSEQAAAQAVAQEQPQRTGASPRPATPAPAVAATAKARRPGPAPFGNLMDPAAISTPKPRIEAPR